MIDCIRTGQWCYQALQAISKMDFFEKIATLIWILELFLQKVPFEMPDWVSECASAEGHTAFKIQAELFLRQQVKMDIVWNLGQFTVNIIQSLKQLSKVSVVLLVIFVLKFFLRIIIKAPLVEFTCSESPCFQHILLNIFRWLRLKYENYS